MISTVVLIKTSVGKYLSFDGTSNFSQSNDAGDKEKFVLEKLHDNRVCIKTMSGQYIAVSADGTSVILTNTIGKCQKFIQEIHYTANVSFKSTLGTYLSSSHVSQDGNLVQSAICLSSEKFEIIPLPEESLPQNYKPAAPLGRFYVRSRLHGMVLDAKGEGKSPGTEIIIWTCKWSKNQQWYFEEGGRIRSAHNNLYIHAKNDTKGSGLVCWKESVESAANQKWEWNGKNISSANSGLVLDVKQQQKAAGAKVILMPNSQNTQSQEWELIDADDEISFGFGES